jgi:hypothetical protein
MKFMMRSLIWRKYGRAKRLETVDDLTAVLEKTSISEVKLEKQKEK